VRRFMARSKAIALHLVALGVGPVMASDRRAIVGDGGYSALFEFSSLRIDNDTSAFRYPATPCVPLVCVYVDCEGLSAGLPAVPAHSRHALLPLPRLCYEER